MPLKLAANITMLFHELPKLSDRYMAVKRAGFHFVECGFPYSEELQTITKAKHESGLKQVLINTWPGTLENGDLGLAALPNRMTEFREKLELSIQYAKALDCERMHVMAGRKPKYEDEAMEEVYLDNLQYSADRLQRENILALIEPINSRITEPNYFLTDIHKAIEYIKKVNHPNLKLMFDCFHIQIMDGNLTKNIKQYLPYIGHIQIASVPDRGEPVDGEIDYQYFFKMLDEVGYEGYIGLEYKPRGNTAEGLKWLKELGVIL